MRILYFGTPAFAVPTLSKLLEGTHTVCGVITQPDKRQGRGRLSKPSPVAQLALERDLPLWRPEKIGAREVERALAAQGADIGVVAAYGQFIPRHVRELPRLGYLINAHASLLPKLRGASPITKAILDGESKTGISIMRVEKEMDAGPVLTDHEIEIRNNENAGELTRRLAQLAPDAVSHALTAIEAGAEFTHQDHSKATFAPKITRADSELDFSDTAESLSRRIRAMAPKPGAFASGPGGLIRILEAKVLREDSGRRPGEYWMDEKDSDAPLRIAASSGSLLPLQLQRPGGKVLPVQEFLRGTRFPKDEMFGPINGAARLKADSTD